MGQPSLSLHWSAGAADLHYLRTPVIPGVIIATRRQSGRPGEATRVPQFRISILPEGSATVRVGTTTAQLAPGAVLLIPSGELAIVTERHTAKTVAMSLLINPGAVDERLHRGLSRLGPGLVGGVASRVPQLLLNLERAIASKQPALAQEQLLASVVRAVAHGPQPEPARPGRKSLRNIRDYIADRYSRDVSLEELERVSGVSRYHLGKMFRAEFGLPPHAYLIAERVYRAQRLLLRGMPASDAAVAVGFSDLSHLTRHFRRSLAVAPGAYQEFMRR